MLRQHTKQDKKTILVHANCANPTAKGDFTFAGNLAVELKQEIDKQALPLDVVLVSTSDGMQKFISLYGTPNQHGRVIINHIDIGLCSLHEFDTVENSVIAYIAANPCKQAATDIIKRVIAPECKFLFIGNANQGDWSDISLKSQLINKFKTEQPQLYTTFSHQDLHFASTGFSGGRIGIPAIARLDTLPEICAAEAAALPTSNYGFMYLSNQSFSDYITIAQYIQLSGMDHYVLVGDFVDNKSMIENTCTFISNPTNNSVPNITFFKSLPNHVMRRTVAAATSPLVLSTGVTSTLEVMQDGKIPFYQLLENNTEFVASILLAVKSLAPEYPNPNLLLNLSALLLCQKPLKDVEAKLTEVLLKDDSSRANLIAINKRIIDKASGTIGRHLLSVVQANRDTKDDEQVELVCESLRVDKDTSRPECDKALRRATATGRMFETKVLVRHISQSSLGITINQQDPVKKRTALHWAVIANDIDTVRLLVQANASMNLRDSENNSPLEIALINGRQEIIALLVAKGARTTKINMPQKMLK